MTPFSILDQYQSMEKLVFAMNEPPRSHTQTDASAASLTDMSANVILTRMMLASRLKVSLRTIDKLQDEGMPCIRIGRSRRFVFCEVIAWLKRKGGQL